MRLLNRLNQYQRLWQPSAGKPQTVTVSELAERCFCSERHVRTLLRQAQEAGWLEWQAQSGRGKRGQLRFLVTPESLRNAMMEQALETGKQQDVLELAQLAPGELRTLLQPFMGGQWQNDTPTLRIPYYRPLEPLQPGFLPGRAEQHLAGQIFSGLTRFDNNTQRPIGDLAHHWETSTDGLRWDFYLRSTLHWHNGDAVKASHLHQRLLMLLQLPALDQLFISVKRIEVTHPQCLTFFLHRPDYWLAHRLASYCSHLAHPQFPLIGTGPFRLTQFTAELVRLESHDYYHLRHPLLKAVEYWITPPLFEKDLGTSCRHPVQITIGKPEELQRVSQVSSGISLGFCYLTLRKSPRLSLWQARKVISIIHQSGLLQTLEVGENLITASHALLPGWTIPHWQVPDEVKLPKTLTLVYHLPIELHTMAERLQATLAAEGCELTIIFHNAKNWDDTTLLAHADLMMGDRLIGEAPEYTLEQWLRCDPLWPHVFDAPAYAHLQSTLDAVQVMPDEENRFNALKAVFSQLMADATLTPLFNYHYRISAPPGVNGVRLTPRGWFEFTEAWLPAPSQWLVRVNRRRYHNAFIVQAGLSMKRAVVVFSGGQDSTTCLVQALQQYDEVHCVTFDYGQRHRAEIDVARELALKLGARAHKVLDVTLLNELAVSSLTRDSIPVPDYEPEADGIPNTFVPGRNILFLTLAAIYAYQVKAEAVITGVCETDFSGYPDCRDEFVKALNHAVSLGMAKDIRFETPLMWIDKAETWALADYYGKLDLVRNETLTCYNGIKGDGCGHCAACNLRANGLNHYLADKPTVMAAMKQKTGLR